MMLNTNYRYANTAVRGAAAVGVDVPKTILTQLAQITVTVKLCCRELTIQTDIQDPRQGCTDES